MNKESFAFVIYMIHACANSWRKVPSDVYKLLQNSGCIDNYLVPILREQNILLKILKNILGSEV